MLFIAVYNKSLFPRRIYFPTQNVKSANISR